ncbi:DUF423 domain-containing protein [Formicincola oecophyllae]|uniref:DUF423 domain-containing protein n=1 Tax=Formicincola oecophyllae TaxID=2558361 RepID=A0A4Y6U993_9PROT|nr:DUF423 domain-containing protein [Formicincola oecophyllae]QDH13026.1 DUF423 domain-containing protein [Formicincola oecophyllae]
MTSSNPANPTTQQPSTLENCPTIRACFRAGAIMGGVGVALAAMGAHLPDSALAQPSLLKGMENDRPPVDGRTMLGRSARLCLVHAAALCALGAASPALKPRMAKAAAVSLATGTALFSGTVALRALKKPVPARLAPLGGQLLIAGWGMLALALPKRRPS